jgi:hypothetical protein
MKMIDFLENKDKEEEFFSLVKKEYKKARINYSPFHSTHEGIAVIQEEVDELWDMVKNNKGRTIKDGNHMMAKECVQIAAMAYAFSRELNK